MHRFRSQHRIRKFEHDAVESVEVSLAELFKGDKDLPTPAEIARSRRHKAVQAYRAKADAKRTIAEIFADWLTAKFGTISFLLGNALVFCFWLLANLNLIPEIRPFDPPPFVMLTTIVSLEAIFLAIVVLISQNRASRIAEIREEEDLQINMIAEEEVTKIIELLDKLLKKNHVNVNRDKELTHMMEHTDSRKIEKSLEEQLL